MMTGQAIMKLDELPVDEAVVIPEANAIVVRTADGVAGFVNQCPHQNLPLTGAHVADGVLICPHHFWRYELSNGQLRSDAEPRPCLEPVEVNVDGNEVSVGFPASKSSPPSLRSQLLARAESWNRDDPPDPNHPGARSVHRTPPRSMRDEPRSIE